MSQINFCPDCGSKIENGICSGCGKNIIQPAAQVQAAQAQPSVFAQSMPGTPINYIQPNQQVDVYGQPLNMQQPYGQPGQGQQAYAQPNQGNYAQPYGQYQFNPNQYGTNNYQNPGYGVNYQNTVATNGSNTKVIIAAVAAAVVLIVCFGFLFKVFLSSQNKINQSVNNNTNSVTSTLPGASIDVDDITVPSTDATLRYGNVNNNLSAILANSEDAVSYDQWELQVADSYEGDEKYYEFDNYIDTSVSYKIERNKWGYINNDGGYDSGSMVYPHDIYLLGDYVRVIDSGLSNEADINKKIYQKTLEIADLAESILYYIDDSYVAYADCETYVSYMDDEVLSILIYGTGYMVSDLGGDNEYTSSQLTVIRSINFDMTTGLEIKASDTFDFSGDFYKTFMDKCFTQNGSAVDYYTEDVLAKYLCDDNQVVWAYTPIGLEVGINRTGYSGWSTCSFTDYSEFIKEY
ncbi:MAG: hypothetical protein MJ107_07545 [Lachnospiraceae bacterium]|nr:hypothetical protein [Lachnospiraceae bacterium]